MTMTARLRSGRALLSSFFDIRKVKAAMTPLALLARGAAAFS
jgi:hypothetical protein